MKKIMLVEDDETIVYGLSALLEEEGLKVTAFPTLLEALGADMGAFSLVLLDLGLPDGEGWRFLEDKRGKDAPPVIILTAKEDEKDIIKGLDMGADDYVTKPFRARVLISRIRAVLRRQGNSGEEKEILRCGNILLDKSRTFAAAGNVEIALTAGEYRLLMYLMENKNRTLTRNVLLQYLWDNCGEYVNDNTLTVTIKRLREKLGEESRQVIKTVRGIGYRMEDF